MDTKEQLVSYKRMVELMRNETTSKSHAGKRQKRKS